MQRFRSATLFVILVLAMLVITACSAGGLAATTPTPTPPPTATPVPSPAEAWARIQATGKIIVGTSADYPPFASYNENFKIEGSTLRSSRPSAKNLG